MILFCLSYSRWDQSLIRARWPKIPTLMLGSTVLLSTVTLLLFSSPFPQSLFRYRVDLVRNFVLLPRLAPKYGGTHPILWYGRLLCWVLTAADCLTVDCWLLVALLAVNRDLHLHICGLLWSPALLFILFIIIIIEVTSNFCGNYPQTTAN